MIRPATEADFEAMDAVQRAAARELCAPAYSPAQIEAWVGEPHPDRYERGMERGAEYYVLEDEGTIVGFSGLNRSERLLDALFIHPSRNGEGLAGRMMEHLLGLAVQAGIVELFVEATLNAASYYARHGFVEYGRGSTPCRGEELACVLMKRDAS